MRVGFSANYDQGLGILILIILVSCFSGCKRSQTEIPVVPPATHPLAREYIGYGVVNVSFTHLLNEQGSGGVSLGYLRKGTVVRIIERKTVVNKGITESWVLAEGNYQAQNASGQNVPAQGSVSRGWLLETALDVFDNESRANTASKSMSQ